MGGTTSAWSAYPLQGADRVILTDALAMAVGEKDGGGLESYFGRSFYCVREALRVAEAPIPRDGGIGASGQGA